MGNTAFGALVKDVSDSSTQNLPFLGSQGAIYKRYDRASLWKTAPAWLTYMQGTPSLTLQS